MKTCARFALVALVSLVVGCAGTKKEGSGSAGTPEHAGLQKMQIVFADFEMQQDTVSRAQPVITVTPTLEVTNPNDIEVTFVKLEMEIRGSPELVQLEQRTWPVDVKIAAGAKVQHRVNIFATLRSPSSTVQLSPLFVSGRAFFSSAQGSFSQGFVQQQAHGG